MTFAIAMGFEFRLIVGEDNKRVVAVSYDGFTTPLRRFPTTSTSIDIKTFGNEYVEFCGLRFVNRGGFLYLKHDGNDEMVAAVMDGRSHESEAAEEAAEAAVEKEQLEREREALQLQRELEREQRERERALRELERELERRERETERQQRETEREQRQLQLELERQQREREREQRQLQLGLERQQREREREQRQLQLGLEREQRELQLGLEREQREREQLDQGRKRQRGAVTQIASVRGSAVSVSQISDGFVSEMVQTVTSRDGARVVQYAKNCKDVVQRVSFD